MNAIEFSGEENSYIKICGLDIYLDFFNDRIKILNSMGIEQEQLVNVIRYAQENKLGKILCNCRLSGIKAFKDAGFKIEGIINGFFKGEDAYCVSYFVDSGRADSAYSFEEDRILNDCMKIKKEANTRITDYKIRDACEEDIPQMINIFSDIFKTYPSPVTSMQYLKESMEGKVLYKVALDKDRIVSIASADMDKENLNAEITDCATYPEYRGKGLLTKLLKALETDLKNRGFYSLYSLSRAINPGINMALRGQGYNYSGRLVNNCNICGGFEDMNIWFKKLRK